MADKRGTSAVSSEIAAKVSAGNKHRWKAKGNCTYQGKWYAAGTVIETDTETAPTKAFEAASDGVPKSSAVYDPTAAIAARGRTTRVTSGMSPVAKRLASNSGNS